MKIASSHLMAALILAPLCQAQDWVNFIRQHQLETQVVWDMPVDSQGNGPSALGVQETGALFQLWTIRQSDAKDFLLDQTLVGTFLPHATIDIETGDPFPHRRRTRADQPFTVKIDVSGLLSGPNIPDAAKQVLVEHHLAPYTDAQTSIELADAIGGDPTDSGMIAQNGETKLEYTFTSLPSTDPTKAHGEEHFVVHALPDQDIGQTQLATDFVEVWPVATASIDGIVPGETVRFSTPQLQLTYEDLYPSSYTYLQIYKGAPSLGTTGAKVIKSERALDQDDSMNLVLRIDNWLKALESDGQHTMEIITETPFGRERLAYLSFNVDREISINAQLHNLESGSR